jgi:hypothetical protein
MPVSFNQVSPTAIASYQHEGVVGLRQIIDGLSLDLCRRRVTRSIANPGKLFRDYTAADSPGRYLFDYWN